MLKSFRQSAERRKTATAMVVAIIQRAREPWFYAALEVPDTFNGRFDMVALHAFLALERLNAEGETALAQDVVNALFYSFEDALRDQGAGDMGMVKRLEKIASAFYGRLEAYRASGGREALTAALLRNVYGEDAGRAEQAGRLADYAAGASGHLSGLRDGVVDFGPLPAALP